MDQIKKNLKELQLIIKVYMVLTGSVDNLGAIVVATIGVLEDLCDGNVDKAADSLRSASIGLLQVLASSVVERATGQKLQGSLDVHEYAELLFDNLSDLGVAEDILPYVSELANEAKDHN